MSEKENGNVVFFVSTSFLPDKAEMGEAAVLCLWSNLGGDQAANA